MNPEVLMTSAQVAASLKVSTETVHRMCRSRKWPHVKVGRLYRFTAANYEAIIAPVAPPVQNSRRQRQRVNRLLNAINQADKMR